MPPSDERGLQIRPSHRRRCGRRTLCLALAALAGVSAVGGASAQEVESAPADSLAATGRLDPVTPLGDTLVAGGAASDPQAARDGGFFRSPTGVMLRSLAVPGWGQAANGEWVKAGLVVAVEGYLIYTLVRDNARLSELDPASLEYATLENQRNANAWWLGGAVFLSMVDAYVGAHLKGIEVRIGPEPETQEVRVGLRREF